MVDPIATTIFCSLVDAPMNMFMVNVFVEGVPWYRADVLLQALLELKQAFIAHKEVALIPVYKKPDVGASICVGEEVRKGFVVKVNGIVQVVWYQDY